MAVLAFQRRFVEVLAVLLEGEANGVHFVGEFIDVQTGEMGCTSPMFGVAVLTLARGGEFAVNAIMGCELVAHVGVALHTAIRHALSAPEGRMTTATFTFDFGVVTHSS